MENLNREKIIEALQRFDEASKGDVFDNIDTETLYQRLNEVDENFSADDLIKAADEGF